MAALSIEGSRSSGQDVRSGNVTACVAIANIVKTSLGPVGLDKMLVDEVGDVTVTNDGATIIKQLEIEHPAGKVLAELAAQQDDEIGDGTTSVVIMAAELLRCANQLVLDKIHPTTVISGLRMAMRECVKCIKKELSTPTEKLGRDVLVNAAKTSLSSKILGTAESDLFANMAVDAVLQTKTIDDYSGKARYPLSSVHILKAQGKSAHESHILEGFALNAMGAAQGMPTYLKGVRIACLDIDLRRTKMKMGVSVLVNNPDEMQKMADRELDITKERIMAILNAGGNLILTTQGIDDTSLKYFVDAGVIACRRVPMKDMKRIAAMTGATLLTSFADLDGNETFEASMLGSADECVEERVRDDKLLLIKGGAKQRSNTVLLRGPNEIMCDEMARSFHDSTAVVKRVLENNAVVAGGGAVEVALSLHLENFALSISSREQIVVTEFADALLVIPKTLAMNAAQDASELLAKLRAKHAESPANKDWGLDLIEGQIRNNLEAGVVEPAISKVKSIQFATEAAITILRIDDLIRLEGENPNEALEG
ncbi:T-complex protein 1 subunit alpha [Porphyridium purpureum]|uniref:T-complex protein 1 subunit alpha n=1 Tax=Porphyridium purpureum TaxID=35688 RepID=A0A5J4YU88_PORPP|nr:T-complex protein 1 subunit alpha [Porphyridium purpureum]|eukprot:POR3780..scf227_4